MGAIAYLLLVLMAAIISAQLTMMMDRRVPLHKRFRDWRTGGDAWCLLFTALLLGSTLGAFVGCLLDAAGIGAVIGLIVGSLSWAVTGVQSLLHYARVALTADRRQGREPGGSEDGRSEAR